MIDIEATTMSYIHDAAWVVLIFTLGMLTGYMLKLVMCNYERMKNQYGQEKER